MSNSETNATPRTPPKQNSLQVLGDTVRVSRTSRSDQRSGLESHRRNAMKDVAAELVEVPALDFCKHYLSSDLSTEKIKRLLQRIPKDVLGKDGWVAFSPISKSGAKITENDRFKNLETIVEAICIAAATASYTDSERTVEFTCRPNNSTLSEITGGSQRIDAFFYLSKDIVRKIKNVDEWLSSGVVCNAEFKLSSDAKEVEKNRSQLVGAAAHFMNNDPRRLHMYSLSIEGDNVRLWYFSRSHSVKSTAFSLHADTELFARFVIALSFPKKDVLGFDKTITRKYFTSSDEDDVEYSYSIGGENYRTIHIISEFYASSIPGRGTRVWLVEQVSTGKKYVLKDYWLDKESKTEKEIQNDIFRKLKDVQQRFKNNDKSIMDKIPIKDRAVVSKALDHYSDYFVAISEEETLTFTPDIYHKFTRCGAVTEEEQPKIKHSPAVLSAESSLRTGQAGNPMERISGISYTEHSNVKRKFSAKKHCRILYEEYCDAAFELTSLRKIIYMLRDSLTAIQLLYLAGYIHRDISCGNVLCAKSHATVVGKLSDLEYARPFDDPNRLVSGDPKTGTPAFMAVDVQSRRYNQWISDYNLFLFVAEDQPPFRHSYLHDLESLFWLALWLFTTRGEEKYANECQDAVSRMKRVDDVFLILQERIKLVHDKFTKDIFDLTFPPEKFPNICEAFAAMRNVLKVFHLHFGTIKMIGDERSYSAIFTRFREIFTELENSVLDGDITVQKVTLSRAPKKDDNSDDRKIYNLRPRDMAPRENPPRLRLDLGWTGLTEGL